MSEDKQMVIDYDLAREAINQLLDELDRLDGSDSEWAETQKSVIRNSLDDCFDLAVKAKSHAAALAAAEERVRKVTEEKEAMRIAWHGLINQGKDFYSWQRDWQDAARLILGLGEDASVEDINLALLLRNAALEGK